MTEPDLVELGISAVSSRRALPLGYSACVWNDERQLLTFNVTVHQSRDILVDTYRAHLAPIFEPFTLEGLPAVREKTGPDAVVCTVTVGTGPNQGIETTWFGTGTRRGPRRDPCESATAVTRTILAKLPPAR